MSHLVAVLGGDGIGPEVTDLAARALTEAAALHGEKIELHEGLIGGHAIDETGSPSPERPSRCAARPTRCCSGRWAVRSGHQREGSGRSRDSSRSDRSWASSPTSGQSPSIPRSSPARHSGPSCSAVWTSWWCGS
jgi:hypothetical protein